MRTVRAGLLSAFICAGALVAAACSPSAKSVKRMQLLEEGVSNPTTVEELEAAIAKYERRAMDLVETQAQEGVWYKMLGVRYLDNQMYGKAYEAFSRAIAIYPNNAVLYYLKGMCASYMANAELGYDPTVEGSAADRKEDYLRTAEEAFQRAIAINPRYYKAMYSLGALYSFQLAEYEKAVPLLEEFLRTQTKNTDGMFVLALDHFSLGEYDKAIALYDQIIDLNPSEQKVNDARRNKKAALDEQYRNN